MKERTIQEQERNQVNDTITCHMFDVFRVDAVNVEIGVACIYYGLHVCQV